MTKEQVLERIAEERNQIAGGEMVKTWALNPPKLAEFLAEIVGRIERLESRPVDAVSPQMTHVVGTPNITPVVELSNVPDGIHFNVTSKSYGPGEKPSQ